MRKFIVLLASLIITSLASAQQPLTFTRSVVVSNNLNVTGSAGISNGLAVVGGMDVTNGSTFRNNVTVKANLIATNLTVDQGAFFQGNVSITNGDLQLRNGSDISVASGGVSIVNGALIVNGTNVAQTIGTMLDRRLSSNVLYWISQTNALVQVSNIVATLPNDLGGYQVTFAFTNQPSGGTNFEWNGTLNLTTKVNGRISFRGIKAGTGDVDATPSSSSPGTILTCNVVSIPLFYCSYSPTVSFTFIGFLMSSPSGSVIGDGVGLIDMIDCGSTTIYYNWFVSNTANKRTGVHIRGGSAYLYANNFSFFKQSVLAEAGCRVVVDNCGWLVGEPQTGCVADYCGMLQRTDAASNMGVTENAAANGGLLVTSTTLYY